MSVQVKLFITNEIHTWDWLSVRNGYSCDGLSANSFDSYKKVLLLSTITYITYQFRCFADRLGLPIVNYWCQSLHRRQNKEKKKVNYLKLFLLLNLKKLKKKNIQSKDHPRPYKTTTQRGSKKKPLIKGSELLLCENLCWTF